MLHQRDGNLPTSWLDAVHTGRRPGRQRGDGLFGYPRQLARFQLRLDEQKIESHVQLGFVAAVIVPEALHVEFPHLAEQRPLRYVAVGDLAPALVNLVYFRAVCVVDLAQPSPPDGRVVSVPSRRVVAQQGIFIKPVRHIDPEAGSTAVEPVLDNFLEFLMDKLVPPVEVGLGR